MRRNHRILVFVLAALIVAAGLSFGLVKAYAQNETALTPITPAELLTRIIDRESTPSAVSGDISVTNELLGSFPAEFGRTGGGGPATFLQSGGGRLWIQGDKARIDAQGFFNDTVLYYDGKKVTIYDSTANKLTVYSPPVLEGTEASEPDGQGDRGDHVTFDPQTAIPQMIEKLAPVATLAVSGSEQVAGRDCYILTLSPTAPNTLFASLQVAVDGETYLPLQIAVYAKGYTEPLFVAGFTSISYDPIDESVFEVPSPAGATTEETQLQLPFDPAEALAGTSPDGGASEETERFHAGLEPLTIDEASAKAGFTVLAAHTTDPAYAFQGAYVLDIPEGSFDIDTDTDVGADGDGADGGTFAGALSGLAGGAGGGLAGMLEGPIVIQVYGEGFSTVVMVQAKTVSIPPDALQSMQAQLPFLQATDVNGAPALQFATPLASLVGWQQEAVTLIAAGSVSTADLTAFAASVR